MKTNPKLIIRRALFSAVAIAMAFAAEPAHAFLGFGGTVKKMIGEAEVAMEEGRVAENEGRVLDACDAYGKAHEIYSRLKREHPGSRAEYVAERDAACLMRIRTLFARAGAGEIAIAASLNLPDEDDGGDAAAPEQPEPAADAQVASAVSPKTAPQAPAAPGADDAPSAAAPASGAAMRATAPQKAPDTFIASMNKSIEGGAAADAVIAMENYLGRTGDAATLGDRLIFCRALVACRNYSRAWGVVAPLLETHPRDRGVLTMAAGIKLARGESLDALRLLDTLVDSYPDFPDAYIDLAWVRMIMDPIGCRNEAILYYKHALELGARRDLRLEAALSIAIQ